MLRTWCAGSALAAMTLGSLTGCGTGISGGPETVLNPINSTTTGARLLAKQSVLIGDYFKLGVNPMGRLGDPGQWGLRNGIQGSPSPLTASFGDGAPTSLAYSVYSIQICESLETNGTGYNNPKGCVVLYKGGGGEDMAAYDAGEAPAPYLDMMKMDEVKATINSGTTVPAGSYNWGIINWYKPIKVQGSVVLKDGTYIHTDGGATAVQNSNSAYAAKVSTVETGNGGFSFKFGSPFVTDGAKATVLDLVYNPDNVLKASSNCSNCNASAGSNGAGINVPILSLTPVPHAIDETAAKEVYRVAIAGFPALYRVELYYVKQDSDKTIRGLDVRLEYESTVDNNYQDVTQLQVQESGTTVSLVNYMGETLMSFTRATSGTTLSLSCPAAGSPGGGGVLSCGNSSATSGTVTYVGTVDVQ